MPRRSQPHTGFAKTAFSTDMKEEIDRVGAALEAKARKPENLLKLQAFMESIDPGIRAEALQRLGFHQVLVEASCPSKRVQYVRKEKPKWKPPQALRRKSTQRASLSVSHVDVNFQTPVEESPAPASPPAPPLPELPELGDVLMGLAELFWGSRGA
eukprot:g33278.t1